MKDSEAPQSFALAVRFNQTENAGSHSWTEPDVPFHEWRLPDGTSWTLFFRHASGYRLRFPGLADFDISTDGLVVQGHPVPGSSDDTLQHLYLNQVLPLALSRQGKLVFHAGAVETPAGAIAFMGVSGRGKPHSPPASPGRAFAS
ncbi:MAG: hypothetical protein Q8K21_03295 [Hydrogenophaga sp.]|uniref:hypothetical protein n=1 Tax=Hydrogenophaga sp. TaxID=1904254 RepID=UPI002731FE5C|nr:hypothetical protein [Hydrogenophaga sp.]MDP2163238.1 hypothetical protein [Hydrogenophaga sp.]MDP3476335.1 hypothetical protein [Hydrogenophaga sp.]